MSQAPTISVEELAELLLETGRRHHAAYAEADGADPEWPLWYAAYLQARLWDRLGSLLTRSQIVYCLIASDREARAKGITDWPPLYAERLLELGAE